jgi:uncharacterized protein (DUF2236 family)
MKTYLGWKVDYATPAGEPALAAPDSVSWRVFKNTAALAIGGVAAVLLEFAEPKIRSGVWDHSAFRIDPVGRSRRTGIAALVGVYGPASAARRIIQGVNNMHAGVSGTTPGGEAYRALDTDLLDWVSATAGFGFLTAYDRFVAPVSAADQARYFAEAAPITALYGVKNRPHSLADFDIMLASRLPRFEAHPINTEFLEIIRTAKGLAGVPKFAARAMAHASVSILPPAVRARLELGPAYDLTPMQARLVRGFAQLAERVPEPGGAPMQACRRLGLPGNFLYRSEMAQAALLAARGVLDVHAAVNDQGLA